MKGEYLTSDSFLSHSRVGQQENRGKTMFGKPEWFGDRDWGIGYLPAVWQGWAYYALWSAAILIPVGLLTLIDKYPESAIWAITAVGAFILDSRRVRQTTAKKRELDRLFYIGDDGHSPIVTEKYQLQLKR
jgi:hypothetical protein